MSTELQPRTHLSQWSPIIDTISKGVGATALAFYVCGFLIVSIDHFRYGFIGTNVLRPRILAAGAWFFFLVAIPIVSVVTWNKPWELTWVRLFQLAYPFYWGAMLLSLLAERIFVFSDNAILGNQSWWWIFPLVLALPALVFLMQWKKSPPIIAAVASCLLVIWCCYGSARELLGGTKFEFGALAVWFFCVGFLTIIELKVRPVDKQWERTPFLVLTAVSVFGLMYYPHIKAAWGGGAPVSATMYFTKDSVLVPTKALSVRLVDESDDGYYIVGPNESRAIFIPRSSVALVYFSDRITDSQLLRDNKQNP